MLSLCKSDWACLERTLMMHCRESNTSVGGWRLWDSTLWRVEQDSPNSYQQLHHIHGKQVYNSPNCLREPTNSSIKTFYMSYKCSVGCVGICLFDLVIISWVGIPMHHVLVSYILYVLSLMYIYFQFLTHACLSCMVFSISLLASLIFLTVFMNLYVFPFLTFNLLIFNIWICTLI